MTSPFAARYADWEKLQAIAESVPSPRPDDNPEMLAQIEVQRELIALPVDDLEELRMKAGLPMLNWQGPCEEHWSIIRADIERILRR